MPSIEIKILGRKYFFKSDDPKKLKKTAKYLESQLEDLNEKFNTVDQSKLLVLYSLMLTEKYLIEEKSNKELEDELERINNLLNDVELGKE